MSGLDNLASKLVGMSAYPISADACSDGMTYRQWLVGMALQGLLSNHAYTLVAQHESSNGGGDVGRIHAKIAIQAADAVLAELERQP